MPSGPIVAMNANASGTPPKFAATPEKVMIRPNPARRSVADRRVGDEEAERARRGAP